MSWQVRISGDAWVLKKLAQLTAGLNPEVAQSEDGYTLGFLGLQESEHHSEVEAGARRHLNILNGLLSLGAIPFLIHAAPLKLSEILLVDGSGPGTCWNYKATVSSIRIGDGEVDLALPRQRVERLLAVINANKAPSFALQMLGLGDDWINLYKIYEIVRRQMGGEDTIAEKGWVPKAKLRAFRQTANSFGAIGLEARHGVETASAPSYPMEHGDAVRMIRTLLENWMDHLDGPSSQ